MTAPAAALPTRGQCIARASAIFARAAAETAWIFAEQGPMAVAEAAHEPGGMPPGQIAQQYEVLHARAVRQRAGAA
jgi:hypothetical protein